MIKTIQIIFFVLSSLMVSLQSHAALFDDTEARKKILNLEDKLNVHIDEQNAKVDALKQNQQTLEAVIKGQGLTDMLNQIQILNNEVAKLKGDLEVANHEIQMMQQREKDLYVDTDERIRKLEVMIAEKEKPAIDAASIENELSIVEKTHFDEAKNFLLAENYKDAFSAFDNFIKNYPESTKLADAKYNLGLAQYSLKNYKSAIATQQNLIEKHPDSPKVPEALMNIANSQIQLGRVKDAKETLTALVKQYPEHELIPTAKKRLKALSAI
jgi:tol-pal system protein YbgF